MIPSLRSKGYTVQHSEHDDQEYIFRYRKEDEAATKNRKLTVPIGRNRLFPLRTNVGYTSFFGKAPQYQAYQADLWCMFAGASHVINDDDSDSDADATVEPREPPKVNDDNSDSSDDATFEPREPPRETQTNEPTPNVIPYADEDINSVKKTAVKAEFHLEEHQAELNDPDVAILRHKQSKLSTIHERLGHVRLLDCGCLPRPASSPKN
jgi:hypothetical protein